MMLDPVPSILSVSTPHSVKQKSDNTFVKKVVENLTGIRLYHDYLNASNMLGTFTRHF